jgi:hypothetical protein
MDSCWQNTPFEIINYILKLACGRLIYRDNRYIEIGKVKETESINKFNCINKFLNKKESLKSQMEWTGNINRSWFLEFQFDNFLYEKDIVKGHGLSFDYLKNNNFEICYWSYRRPVSAPSWTGPWTRIRTFI